ncbi:TetR/AcrR family transcriptional regulator [Parageobacillus sp. VR-IP]|uniref:TetR/AcrR family transcriptional regulator n=1 Tax=Parageobacillus sp. VR-IP TaxID=2742205 RepID=UPI001581B965|nr:TetR/AcrR family transcriptional regulator [Parageobacillus sp. VR-IP]NUK30818.1 TetR/AcrR family transcriptional regulator [Parageobacillus sp. VR-IP]
MNRKEEIIQAAMKLFAQKGYYATSMQEIAEQSGIAKGSIYNYFKSKEEIAVSILRYYYDVLFRKMKDIADDVALSAREKFEKQLSVQIEEFYRHKELVQMHMGEQTVKVNDEVHRLVFRIRAKMLNWYRRAIEEIYGEKVRRFSLDCATMLNGMLKEYLFYMAIDRKQLPLAKMAPFLLRRLDALVASMNGREEPLLTIETMHDYLFAEQTDQQERQKQILAYLDHMIAAMPINGEMEEDVRYSLETLKLEMKKGEEARPFMVDALLLYLEKWDLPLYNELKAAIERYFDRQKFSAG